MSISPTPPKKKKKVVNILTTLLLFVYYVTALLLKDDRERRMFVGKLYRRLHLCIVSRLLDIASNNSMSIYCTRMLVASYVLGLYQADRTVYRPIGDDEIGNNYPTLCVTCTIICFSRRFRVRCKASKGFCFLIVFIKSCPFGANNISIGATNN